MNISNIVKKLNRRIDGKELPYDEWVDHLNAAISMINGMSNLRLPFFPEEDEFVGYNNYVGQVSGKYGAVAFENEITTVNVDEDKLTNFEKMKLYLNKQNSNTHKFHNSTDTGVSTFVAHYSSLHKQIILSVLIPFAVADYFRMKGFTKAAEDEEIRANMGFTNCAHQFTIMPDATRWGYVENASKHNRRFEQRDMDRNFGLQQQHYDITDQDTDGDWEF